MASCGAKAYFSNIKTHPKIQQVEGVESPLVCEVGFKPEVKEETEEDKERKKEEKQIQYSDNLIDSSCLSSTVPHLSIYDYCD